MDKQIFFEASELGLIAKKGMADGQQGDCRQGIPATSLPRRKSNIGRARMW
jgi:hypothetical protein